MKDETKNISLPLIAIILTLVAGIAGCTKDAGVGKPGPNEVWMLNTAYTPAEITVPVNTTIKWTNQDDMEHTVTSDSGLFDSGTLNLNDIFSHTFTTVGEYPYYCNFHTNMKGKVIVQ